ncbi:hypothetical protein [Streptomyces sp. NPDC051218]|uniref:hypothetical protein n=1 Tax=Streptomyces sp. NPDC051218 TaxID=3365645 RepID=UPI00379B2F3F
MLRPANRWRRTSGYGAAGVALALLVLTGCGSSSGDGGTGGPTATDTASKAAAKDEGPLCVGKAPAAGLHVLRGGGFRLPGGGGVQYTEAGADGTTRTATLREGEKYESGQKKQTVKLGEQVTASGHAYAVRQICAYRVVLEPKSAADKSEAAAAPRSLKSAGGEADNGLCFTTNPKVLATAANGFPAEGQDLSLLANSTVQRFPTGQSLTVSYVDSDAGTAGFGAACAGIPVATYEDARVGDTVEFAGVLFKVSKLTEEAVRLTRASA